MSVCNNKSTGAESQSQSDSSHIETQQAENCSSSTPISDISKDIAGFAVEQSLSWGLAVLLQTARTNISLPINSEVSANVQLLLDVGLHKS